MGLVAQIQPAAAQVACRGQRGVEQVLLGEIEVDAAAAGLTRAEVADIVVSYTDVASGQRRTETASAFVSFDSDRERAEKSLNATVMHVVELLERSYANAS